MKKCDFNWNTLQLEKVKYQYLTVKADRFVNLQLVALHFQYFAKLRSSWQFQFPATWKGTQTFHYGETCFLVIQGSLPQNGNPNEGQA